MATLVPIRAERLIGLILTILRKTLHLHINKMTNKNPRSKSRTMQRYERKKAIARSARPVSTIGGGGGVLGPSISAGGMWG